MLSVGVAAALADGGLRPFLGGLVCWTPRAVLRIRQGVSPRQSSDGLPMLLSGSYWPKPHRGDMADRTKSLMARVAKQSRPRPIDMRVGPMVVEAEGLKAPFYALSEGCCETERAGVTTANAR